MITGSSASVTQLIETNGVLIGAKQLGGGGIPWKTNGVG